MSKIPDPPARLASYIAGKINFTDLAPRVISGVVLAGLALGALSLGGVWLTFFWFIASAAVHWEWQRMVGGPRQILRVLFGSAILAIIAMLVTPRLDLPMFDWLLVQHEPALGILIIGCALSGLMAGAKHRIWSAFGLCYAGILLISVCILGHAVHFGSAALLWLFAIVWGTDVMAYFGGRIVGGPKLWPRVSPSKTWSGTLIGMVSGALIGLAVAPAGASIAPLFLLGLALSALSQCGDLFESVVKRIYGVKDSSHIIPGHGGFMDRLDGFIIASAFACLLGASRFGSSHAAAGLFQW